MARVSRYCKAVSLSAFERYPCWRVLARTDALPPQGGNETPYLFLHENLVVTAGIFLDESVVFDALSPEWDSFCRVELEFQVPEQCLDRDANASAHH